jgi:hypothetical protein
MYSSPVRIIVFNFNVFFKIKQCIYKYKTLFINTIKYLELRVAVAGLVDRFKQVLVLTDVLDSARTDIPVASSASATRWLRFSKPLRHIDLPPDVARWVSSSGVENVRWVRTTKTKFACLHNRTLKTAKRRQ